MPDLISSSTGSARLAIGPANFAGQAAQWARAVRDAGLADAWAFTRSNPFGFSDVAMLDTPLVGRHPRVPVGASPVAGVLADATHVALDGFWALSGGQRGGDLVRDVSELQAEGRSVALIGHGSDVRNPIRHMRRVRHSWFKGAPPRYLAGCMLASARSAAVRRRTDLPVFVSTPDLLHDVPGATWLPLTIDVDAWATARPALSGTQRPRVLHCPSRRKPAIKGTEVISPVLRSMEAEGLIDYVEPSGVSHGALKTLVQECDVVVDQICSDAYGVTAVEAMAAGRLVVASLASTRSLISAEVPIVEATPSTFERVMRNIVGDLDGHATIAAGGQVFARRVHDGTKAAQVLGAWITAGS